MISVQVIFPCWVLEVVPQMFVPEAVVGPDVVRVPLLEVPGLTLLTGLRRKHVSISYVYTLSQRERVSQDL